MSSEGKLFILSAPSGTGKSTLVKKLCERQKSLERAVTCTTRPKRAGEVDGKDYHFFSEKEFLEKVERGEFLEHALVFGNHYGTQKSCLEKIRKSGKDAIAVLDTQGALELKKKEKAVYIFLLPPTYEDLQLRLKKRHTDSKEAIDLRLSWSQHEIGKALLYDYQVVNDNLEVALNKLEQIYLKEKQ